MTKTTTSLVLVAAALLSAAGIARAASNVIPPEVAWDQRVARDALYRMELRDEANANYLTRAQSRRIQAAMAAKRARANAELAAYQQFKYDRRLALAEARTGRAYEAPIVLHPEELQSVVYSRGPRTSGYRTVTTRVVAPGSGTYVVAGTSATERLSHYPTYFWTLQARERSNRALNRKIISTDAPDARLVNGPATWLRPGAVLDPIAERIEY